MTPDQLRAGQLIRLKADPGRKGVLSGRQRQRGSRDYYQVVFPDGQNFVLRDQIEPITAVRDDPLDLLQQGKLGRARDLRGHLTHIRLTGRLANLIYSMNTTNTDFYPYQFRPVLTFLDLPSGGLLVADEVGLGKTIEQG